MYIFKLKEMAQSIFLDGSTSISGEYVTFFPAML